jgi:hypothetical protein
MGKFEETPSVIELANNSRKRSIVALKLRARAIERSVAQGDYKTR